MHLIKMKTNVMTIKAVGPLRHLEVEVIGNKKTSYALEPVQSIGHRENNDK